MEADAAGALIVVAHVLHITALDAAPAEEGEGDDPTTRTTFLHMAPPPSAIENTRFCISFYTSRISISLSTTNPPLEAPPTKKTHTHNSKQPCNKKLQDTKASTHNTNAAATLANSQKAMGVRNMILLVLVLHHLLLLLLLLFFFFFFTTFSFFFFFFSSPPSLSSCSSPPSLFSSTSTSSSSPSTPPSSFSFASSLPPPSPWGQRHMCGGGKRQEE